MTYLMRPVFLYDSLHSTDLGLTIFKIESFVEEPLNFNCCLVRRNKSQESFLVQSTYFHHFCAIFRYLSVIS